MLRFLEPAFRLRLSALHLPFAPLCLGARSLLCLSALCSSFLWSLPAEARLHFETTALKDTVEPDARHYAFSFPFENKGDQPVEIKDILPDNPEPRVFFAHAMVR